MKNFNLDDIVISLSKKTYGEIGIITRILYFEIIDVYGFSKHRNDYKDISIAGELNSANVYSKDVKKIG